MPSISCLTLLQKIWHFQCMKQFNLSLLYENACKWASVKLRRSPRDWSVCRSLSLVLSLALSCLRLIQNIRYYQCMKQFNLFSFALSHMKTSKWVSVKLSGRMVCFLSGQSLSLSSSFSSSLCFCDQSICQRSDLFPSGSSILPAKHSLLPYVNSLIANP